MLLLVIRVYNLKRTNFDIDNLAAQLARFSKYLKPYGKIGFVDNTQGAVSVMAVQYILVPHIIVNNLSPDTLLLVQYKGGKSVPGDHKIISWYAYKDKVILLAIRAK
jgi:hypothetical protein